MKKTDVIINGNKLITVNNPDWDDEQLRAKVQEVFPSSTIDVKVENPFDAFPDLEFNEQGERCVSLIDLMLL